MDEPSQSAENAVVGPFLRRPAGRSIPESCIAVRNSFPPSLLLALKSMNKLRKRKSDELSKNAEKESGLQDFRFADSAMDLGQAHGVHALLFLV